MLMRSRVRFESKIRNKLLQDGSQPIARGIARDECIHHDLEAIYYNPIESDDERNIDEEGNDNVNEVDECNINGNNEDVQLGRHFLGQMDVVSTHCSALHWKDEQLSKSLIINPLFGQCCLQGFAPNSTTSIFSTHFVVNRPVETPEFGPEPIDVLLQEVESSNRSLMAETLTTVTFKPGDSEKYFHDETEELISREQIILIATMSSNDQVQVEFLRRLGNTLKLVPILWIVVEPYLNFMELS
ncbi:hypothetical protein GIB67_002560 [Kingdonia uniflora]|uniref:Uncharacterized protein n=1 Tax=Kingdonia uniflora TaxID=39325 RepID=A0A7J7N8S9_9MAGN|nr:hypothetical protein GIB67_002560 [Kingdonia uniflora]